MVASSTNQIQSEYYDGNRAVSVEGIELDHFRESQQSQAFYGPSSPTSHAVFHSFLSDNSKHDADTTAAHSKHIIELFKKGENPICRSQYNLGKYRWLCRAIQICYSVILTVNIDTCIEHNY